LDRQTGTLRRRTVAAVDELWKAVATGLVTLVIGFAGFQLQQGGRRRRRRRELREEIELLALIDKRSPSYGPMRARVDAMIARYEPPITDSPPVRSRRGVVLELLILLGANIGIGAVVASAIEDHSTWAWLLIGTGVGVLSAVLGTVASRRIERRSVERAEEEALQAFRDKLLEEQTHT
jgi:hypothetical protein